MSPLIRGSSGKSSKCPGIGCSPLVSIPVKDEDIGMFTADDMI